MLLKRRLRAIIGDTEVPGGLLMKAGLSTFPNLKALERFFTDAGIQAQDEREALNALSMLQSSTLSGSPRFRSHLASFFKLSGAHQFSFDERHGLTALPSAYRVYMTLKDHSVFELFAPGDLTPEEIREVASVADYVPAEYLRELGIVKMHADDSLYSFLNEKRFPLTHAWEDGVPAEAFLVLHPLTSPKSMKAVTDAGMPTELAAEYLRTGLDGEQAVRCWEAGIPPEYASTL